MWYPYRMSRLNRPLAMIWIGWMVVFIGCRSPYYADRGALGGGLAGAGVGAIVGNAVGSTAAGAAIGAGVGALTGAAVGNSLDEIAAQNRAQIAGQLGRQVQAGAANVGEVVAMSRAGVDSRLIVNYVNSSGIGQPVTSQDVIYLHQQGVSSDVIQVMQTPRVARGPGPPPGTVLLPGQPGCYYPPRHHYYYPPHHHGYYGPRFGWGVSIHH